MQQHFNSITTPEITTSLPGRVQKYLEQSESERGLVAEGINSDKFGAVTAPLTKKERIKLGNARPIASTFDIVAQITHGINLVNVGQSCLESVAGIIRHANTEVPYLQNGANAEKIRASLVAQVERFASSNKVAKILTSDKTEDEKKAAIARELVAQIGGCFNRMYSGRNSSRAGFWPRNGSKVNLVSAYCAIMAWTIGRSFMDTPIGQLPYAGGISVRVYDLAKLDTTREMTQVIPQTKPQFAYGVVIDASGAAYVAGTLPKVAPSRYWPEHQFLTFLVHDSDGPVVTRFISQLLAEGVTTQMNQIFKQGNGQPFVFTPDVLHTMKKNPWLFTMVYGASVALTNGKKDLHDEILRAKGEVVANATRASSARARHSAWGKTPPTAGRTTGIPATMSRTPQLATVGAGVPGTPNIDGSALDLGIGNGNKSWS